MINGIFDSIPSFPFETICWQIGNRIALNNEKYNIQNWFLHEILLTVVLEWITTTNYDRVEILEIYVNNIKYMQSSRKIECNK